MISRVQASFIKARVMSECSVCYLALLSVQNTDDNIRGKISNSHIQGGPENMSFSSTAEKYLVFFYCVQVVQDLSD